MVRLQQETLDVSALLCGCQRRAGGGAVVSCTGLVRGVDAGKAPLSSMYLEHYAAMAGRELALVEAEARRRWALLDVVIVHRYGRLVPGEVIVFVATASLHRKAAFASCMFVMDILKAQAPFWKFEERGGEGQWVDSSPDDEAAASAWRAGAPPCCGA